MRCFVAAWPDPPTRLALAALSDDLRQRVAHRRASRIDDLHLTLAFIGDVADGTAHLLAEAIATMRVRPFSWRLDMLGCFEEARVVWAGSSQPLGRPLLALADRVRTKLDQFDLDYDRRPLAPHVTLLRGVQRFDLERITPILWRVDSIALYRSAPAGQASRYTRVLC